MPKILINSATCGREISKGKKYARGERVNEYLGLSKSGQQVKHSDEDKLKYQISTAGQSASVDTEIQKLFNKK